MENIKGIHLNHLRNDEHFQFITFVLKFTNESGEPQYRALVEAHGLEDEALKKIVKSALTTKIHEADHIRDEVFRSLADTVKAATHHFDYRMRDAAVNLKIVFDTYGNVNEESDIAETSAVQNIIAELHGKYSKDVETLNMYHWVAELERRNNDVSELLAGRYVENAERTPLLLKNVREHVDRAYYALATMAEAQALVASAGENPADAALFDSFTRRLNELIDTMLHTLAQRRGAAAAEHAKKKAKDDGRIIDL